MRSSEVLDAPAAAAGAGNGLRTAAHPLEDGVTWEGAEQGSSRWHGFNPVGIISLQGDAVLPDRAG